jgi:hypothetical protein
MTYEIYALFPKGSYLVSVTNDAEFGLDGAEKFCKDHNIKPHGYASIIRGEHTIRGNVFTLNDLINDKGM